MSREPVSTLGSTEPYLPTFESMLALYDTDHDGRLWREEFKAYKDFSEHFGWIDGALFHAKERVCSGARRLAIGNALFEVTQPRVTCYRVGIRMKVGLHIGPGTANKSAALFIRQCHLVTTILAQRA